MKTLKNKWRNLPLRRFFILTVFLSVVAVAFISALIIGGCVYFRHWLLPDSDAVYLMMEKTFADGASTTEMYRLNYGQAPAAMPHIIADHDGTLVQEDADEIRYSIQKVENSFDMLSPKRKYAYQACGIIMVAAPTVLAFAGIFLCSIYFYRRKMKQPIELLSGAADKIARQDLDFSLAYGYEDEMGALCHSFEHMREALHENNKKMWEMMEERRLLQASVAHDLRNPIAIIEGYAEYLDAGLANGTITQEKTAHIVQNLNMAAKRLEQYTESVRLLNQSEDMELSTEQMFVSELAENIAEDMRLMAQQQGIALCVTKNLPNQEIQVDTALLYRILENIMSNALRFAKKEICLDFTLLEHIFSVTITDDGEGFSADMQNKKNKILFSAREDGHMGIGLAVSRLLCKKHGGGLELFNTPDGACVKITLSV